MKGPHRSEMVIDENLEWIEQHHRNTTHRSTPHASHSLSPPPATFDMSPSGDESDSADRHRQSQFYVSDPQKLTKEYHIDQAVQAIQLLKEASKTVGWKKVLKHKSGCLVYQSTGNGDKHPAFKGEHVIRGYRAQDVFSVVGVRKLWDDWYDELSLVESYDNATNLMYMVMKGTLSSKTRDISMVERIEVERDGTIYFASCSVESNKIPRISGKVRADIFVAGWIIQPLPSNPPITKITYVIQTDLLSRLPKFIAKRSLAKRPLVITTIETHLKKNGVPMVMSTLVSQTANRHRSLSEPLKPEKFMFNDPEPEESIQSGSAFLSPIGPFKSGKDVEQLESKEDEEEEEEEDLDDEDIQFDMTPANEPSTARSSRQSLAPSTMSNRSLAPSILSPEFLENNKYLGDTALFGDSLLFGKGGIYENSMRQQDEMSTTSSEDTQSRSSHLAQTQAQLQNRTRPTPPQARRTLPPESDMRNRLSAYRMSAQSHSRTSDARIRTARRDTHSSTPDRPTLPPIVTPATPPLTPTTSVDGKDATSDSDVSLTSKVKVIPRVPKPRMPQDASLPARPSSMAFAAFGMQSPSAIMEARRHSTLIARSSSFAPRHSQIIPIRGNPNISLHGLGRSSLPVGSTSNAMKRSSTAPSVDSNRSSAQLTPLIVLPHRHSETARKALAMFKVLASSPEDRWRAVSNEGMFKSYSRIISGAGLPMLRGEGVITGGWSVEQINAVIESSGCRQIWDERFENMSIAETFNSNEYLFHVTLRGIGSLTGRDLAGVTIIDRDPQTAALYNVSTSVLDPTIPEDPGRIRALLELSGWSLRPTFDGQGNTVSVNVTFVIQIDIRGMLPNSVVRSITTSMMTAVSRLNQFINKTGYPPYSSHISGTRLLDTFEPKTGFYELCYKAAPGWTEVRVGRKVYKDGYDFFIKPDDPTVRVELAPDFGGVRVWTTLDHEGQSIVAQVTRKGHVAVGDEALQEQSQQRSDDEEDDEDKTGRHKRESVVPRRPRDSRVFESTTPMYGGPSLRKSPSHLKSNDLNYSTEHVENGSSADAGAGSDLRPHGAPSSISRKRRSASYTTLSAFNPNLIVVSSSSDRLDESSQASTVPKASQVSERSRSRSRTTHRQASVLTGTPLPPPPRRSSSLGRCSIPIASYLPQSDAPPVPINSSLISPVSNQACPQQSPSSILVPFDTGISSNMTIDAASSRPTSPISSKSPTSPISSAPLLSPASQSCLESPSSSEYSGAKAAVVSSPLSSPTLGHFHIPLQPIEHADDHILIAANESTSIKATILQPAAEIPSCSPELNFDPKSLLIVPTVFADSSTIRTPIEKHDHDKEQAPEPEHVQEATISLATMRSPLSSPLPAPTRTMSALEPLASSLKHSSSSTSIGGTRRVTFSPDVIDNSENRTPVRRSKKSIKRKSNVTTASAPVIEDGKTKTSKQEEVLRDASDEGQTAGVLTKELMSQEKDGDQSEEEEFVEALTDLTETSSTQVTECKPRTPRSNTMTMDHMQDNEVVWGSAVESFIAILNSTQRKVVALFMVVLLYLISANTVVVNL
ncbi:hypothetical protein BG011_008776 [Mortierella polycephala]|uniref:START domain-containing protein n=1 Tax=Mortierella polycephala TaxID=41804 RepID=A0A9P6PQG9_9FUNG|nr:hypothetical protein BG011_008776 [Mortierella polycephala]